MKKNNYIIDSYFLLYTSINDFTTGPRKKKIPVFFNLYVKRRSIFYLLTNQTEKAEHETCIY